MAKLDFRPAEVQGLEVIADFAKAVSTGWGGNSLYRGHGDRAWKPLSSAFRPDAKGIEEKAHLREWKSVAQRFVSPQPTSDLGYLVLAQHYGIATALLDWTSNPLMALFFACQEPHDSDGEVVRVQRGEFQTIEKLGSVGIFMKSRPQPLLIDTSAMNVRSTAQDSYMTLHTRAEPLITAQAVFPVPSDMKYAVSAALCIFGLTPERVYVDLERAARRFQDRLDFDHLLQEALG